ncbi:MAG: LptA/OstA family protein [Hyphomicrobiales bacterium]
MKRCPFAKAALRGFLAALVTAGLAAPAFAELAKSPASPKLAAKTPSSSDKTEPTDPKQGAAKPTDSALFPTKSKDPIYITADRLDIYDKEGRAVYSGPSGVVATQGPSKLVGTELTAYYERQHDGADKQAAGGGQPMSGSAVKRILVKGPVSVVQNDQVATGDAADFDRVQNIVTLTGHVSMTQGPNVTTGDKLIYYLNTGVANVFSAPGTPVKSLFVQGSQAGDPKAATPQKAAPGKATPTKPAPGKAAKQQ